MAFDHTAGRSVKGVNFIFAIYHSWEMSLPVGVSFIKKDTLYKDKNGKEKRKSSISKHEHFRDRVKHSSDRLRFKYVLSDSWFACADNMNFVVKDCDWDFIMAFKENRKVALSKEDKLAGKYISIKEAVPEGCEVHSKLSLSSGRKHLFFGQLRLCHSLVPHLFISTSVRIFILQHF